MTRSPTVSVVIPTYNGAHFLPDALDSVLTQTVTPDEVIVVDDGSTDDTRNVVSAYADRVRYLHKANGGPSSARNAGIRASRGALIALLDNDDRWLPTKLEKQVQYLEDNPDVDLVHCDVLFWEAESGKLWHPGIPRAAFSGRCYLHFFFRNGVLPSTMVVRRRCFEVAGLFDEDSRAFSAEDLDECIRISRTSSFGYIPESLVHYRRHPNNLTLDGHRHSASGLYVYQKALRSDPELRSLLGAGFIAKNLCRLAYNAAYHALHQGDAPHARSYLRIAIRNAPLHPYWWSLWASTFLPPKLRNGLRSLKARLAR